MSLKIGVLVDSYRLPLAEALDAAAESGADGVQLFATSGAMAPWNLDGAARRSLLAGVEARGLILSALCGDLGGHGFELRADNREKVRKSEQIVGLAAELGVPVMTTHIGVVPEHRNATYRVMVIALRELTSFARMHGVAVAIETGPEPPVRLLQFIEDVGEEGLGVNFDPANLVMVQGCSAAEAFETLRDYTVYTHAKDGRMVKKGDPVAIYNAFAEGAPDDFRLDDYFLELPLGEGAVDFPAYLRAVAASRYEGYLTIERESGDDRRGDIARGVAYLRDQLKRLVVQS